mmetsp:Transcript_31246/g.96735  ORF Transcript_31246/g.96735 Transcript_31246/m.96735 type:complete len:149 (-) Transcript_31246:51-497(-)
MRCASSRTTRRQRPQCNKLGARSTPSTSATTPSAAKTRGPSVGSSSDSDDDSDDEELALQLELEKIKREREDERLRKEAEARRERDDAALTTNPLLNDNPSGAVKRKWNDDVVFRHQARGAPEKKGKTFINDTIRNDFHKRFLAKYIQ